jgi:hypothetical protein
MENKLNAPLFLAHIVAIEPLSDISQKDEAGNSVRVFTRGQLYQVCFCLSEGLRVIDDTKLPHEVRGDYLTSNFKLHGPKPKDGSKSNARVNP